MNQIGKRPNADIKQTCSTCSKTAFAGLIIAVCAAVLLVHWPALSAKTISFDDDQYLLRNFLVQNPSWSSAKHFLTEVLRPSTVGGYYQPLTMISLMLDCALGGSPENLVPFHATSLALHTANTALIIILLWLLFGRPWIAAGAGLLFGLHPMTVETIPWIGERKTLLSAFFALWCLVFYVRFSGKKNWALYGASLVMYMLALMAKPISVPIPAAMLLMDYWPLRRLSRKSVSEKVPFFIIAAVSAAITYISQTTMGAAEFAGGYGAKRLILVVCHNIIFYLFKIVYPANLSSFYPFPEPLAISQPMVLAGVAGSILLIVLLIISLRRTKSLLIGWLIFFVMIFPAIGVLRFSNVIASDKYAYLPSIGLLMILAAFLGWFCGAGGKNKVKTKCITVSLILLLLAGGESVATRRYLSHWRNTTSFCRYMLSLTPRAPTVHFMLGQAYCSQGELDEGIEQYKQALQYDPCDTGSYNNMGIALAKQNKIDEAIVCFTKAIELWPDFYDAHYNLGKSLQMKGEIDEAIEHLQKAIGYNPYYIEAYNNLAIAFQQQGKLDKAVEYYHKAIEIAPDYAVAHYNLGLALLRQNKLDEAISHFRTALKIQPDYTKAQISLEQALKMKKGNK